MQHDALGVRRAARGVADQGQVEGPAAWHWPRRGPAGRPRRPRRRPPPRRPRRRGAAGPGSRTCRRRRGGAPGPAAVDRHQHQPGPEHGEDRLDAGERVLHDDRHPRPVGQAQGTQGAGPLLDRGLQLGPGAPRRRPGRDRSRWPGRRASAWPGGRRAGRAGRSRSSSRQRLVDGGQAHDAPGTLRAQGEDAQRRVGRAPTERTPSTPPGGRRRRRPRCTGCRRCRCGRAAPRCPRRRSRARSPAPW